MKVNFYCFLYVRVLDAYGKSFFSFYLLEIFIQLSNRRVVAAIYGLSWLVAAKRTFATQRMLN